MNFKIRCTFSTEDDMGNLRWEFGVVVAQTSVGRNSLGAPKGEWPHCSPECVRARG